METGRQITEEIIENFSCGIDTTYETVSQNGIGATHKVTHKIGMV